MSAQPPSSDRPKGPPSGPLSGPSRPGAPPPPGTPSGPPSGPPGDGGTGGPGDAGGPGGPGRPWWRSVPRIAAIAAAIVVAVVLTVVLTRPDGGQVASGEVFLEPAASSGPDPYTESTARNTSAATASPTTPPGVQPGVSPTRTNVTRAVDGSAPGLYGGTRNVASCNVEKQISALTSQQDKNAAFASVLDVDPTGVPAYLRSLTPVQLRMDTRVTNHGYRNGAPTPYQAVLQAGTAVLVDDRGVPRVRCACGNPLRPPVAIQGTPKRAGTSWPGYRPTDVVTVAPADKPVKEFIVYDPENEDWFTRDRGDTGDGDEQTTPPTTTDTTSPPRSPDESPLTPASPESPLPESPASEPASPETDPESPAPDSPAPASPVTPLPPAPDTPVSDPPNG
ncbi:DUF6777 domain-containing protein [Streptomyces flavidovirens]|uniref:DUF6777 domain-containing protein n=1 Tax=Streptomyces flavidovirens TaxID=67298 RepID=UPI000407780E|nr:DUF6777 domain-containing protein [Streptomyces flavidovirens]